MRAKCLEWWRLLVDSLTDAPEADVLPHETYTLPSDDSVSSLSLALYQMGLIKQIPELPQSHLVGRQASPPENPAP